MIIGISGKAESGKDVIAARLVGAHGFTRRAFADALKIEWWDNTFPGMHRISENAKLACVNAMKNEGREVRDELQATGQGARLEHPDHWIDQLFDWWDACCTYNPDLVIPDVRYTDEAQAIKDRGGLVIRVERPGHQNRLTPEQRAHPRECDLDDYEDFDYVLHNSGTVEALHGCLDWLVEPPVEIHELVAANRPTYFLKEYE